MMIKLPIVIALVGIVTDASDVQPLKIKAPLIITMKINSQSINIEKDIYMMMIL